LAHPIGGAVRQLGGQFLAAASDGLLVHPGDLGEETVAAMADAVRFQGDIPAALLFVEAREKQVHVVMSFPVRMRFRLTAMITLAAMDGTSIHRALRGEMKLRLRDTPRGIRRADVTNGSTSFSLRTSRRLPAALKREVVSLRPLRIRYGVGPHYPSGRTDRMPRAPQRTVVAGDEGRAPGVDRRATAMIHNLQR
jgi:hypothetical protein